MVSNFDFKVNNFDLIRIFAAFQVALYHGLEHFDLYAGFQATPVFYNFMIFFPGVPIFFVVSGFLISASLERSVSIKSYLINRVVRIYPALWGGLIIFLFTTFIFFDVNLTFAQFFLWFFAQLSILQFYWPEALKEVGATNGVLWTIPVELQFYLTLPVLYYVFNKFKFSKLTLIFIFISFILVNQTYVHYYENLDNAPIALKLFGKTIFPYLYIFLLGVMIQRNMWFVKKYLAGNAHFFLMLYIVVELITYQFELSVLGNFLNPLSVVFLSFLVISFAYSYTSSLTNINRGYDLSYGLYIYHMIFANVLLEIGLFDAVSNLFIMFLLSICCALLSWRFIERPAIKLKSTLNKKVNYSINSMELKKDNNNI
ncbi:acyltransferase family protein [Vibrio breoganii]